MIDQDLYSRQLYVLGSQAMLKMSTSSIVLLGLGGLGVEIAKNLVLAGVGSLTLVDASVCQYADLETQFFITEQHVRDKQTRAHASLDQLKQLNPYVRIEVLPLLVDADIVAGKYDCVILTEWVGAGLHAALRLDDLCRRATSTVRFLMSDVVGLFGACFNDLGDQFTVVDADGEEYREEYIGCVRFDTQPPPLATGLTTATPQATITVTIETLDNKLHNVERDDLVRLSEMSQAPLLDAQVGRVVDVLTPRAFRLELLVASASSAAVDLLGSSSGELRCGGQFKKVKKPSQLHFEPLAAQLLRPNLTVSDLSEAGFAAPYFVHIGLLALSQLSSTSSNSSSGGEQLDETPPCSFAQYAARVDQLLDEFNRANSGDGEQQQAPTQTLTAHTDSAAFERIVRVLFATRTARFPPLAAIYGGVVAQEALKSITGKFLPVRQWLHLEVTALYEPRALDTLMLTKADELDALLVTQQQQQIVGQRYNTLRVCFGGERTLQRLRSAKVFMVGCGAIGCEMLKNLALLGVATDGDGESESDGGLLTITDNDLIEKSNLNRQFLFRAADINRPKSLVAAQAARRLNGALRVHALEKKVGSQTEQDVFTDAFVSAQHVCVNALDNVEARRYMDGRCVANQRPLLESGTLGAKGHVQVIVPHLTESYTSQRDPSDENAEIPYCTLKSFPSNISHCIQWSRDKFESVCKIKPTLLNKFLGVHADVRSLVGQLRADEHCVVEQAPQAAKMCRAGVHCATWRDCVRAARHKFEKYFAHKALDLLHAYPADHLMQDGSFFWKLPRRAPRALRFDPANRLHAGFVVSLARLYAQIYGIKAPHSETEATTTTTTTGCDELSADLLEDVERDVPAWRPVRKHIETDESKKKEDAAAAAATTAATADGPAAKSKELSNAQMADIFETFVDRQQQQQQQQQQTMTLRALDFEKDDDSNGHVDFIMACSNLRAAMYSIEPADKLTVKRISGKIVPAIATTTSCVAGFVSVELCKVLRAATVDEWKRDESLFRNLFLNLGIALFLQSEPGACAKTRIADNCYVSLWDKWTIRADSDGFTLRQFIDAVKLKYKLTVSGVIYGSKSIYIPVMPGHAKRLNEKMLKLTKGVTDFKTLMERGETNYVDLHLTYTECDSDMDRDRNNLCPPIRFFFA